MFLQGRGVSILLVCLLLGGCGPRGLPEPKRVLVSGTVTLDGKPLSDGIVYFKTPEEGLVDGVEIKEGKFEGKAATGERRVEICQFREGPPYIDMGFGKMPTKSNTIPKRYNSDSTFTVTVTDRGPNEFTFEVKSN